MGEYVYLIAESSDDDETKTQVPCEPPSSEPRNTVAIIITLSVFAIIIGAILAASVVEIESHSSPLKSVCSEAMATQHRPGYSCFNHTLHLALKEVENISSLLKTLIPRSSGLQTSFVMTNCDSLFDDAVYQLSRSVEMMKAMNVVLTKEEMTDMKTWVSAAMTDQETCVNGLEEMGWTNVDEVKVKMIKRSSDLLSNCLAILDNIDGKFGSWASFALRFIP